MDTKSSTTTPTVSGWYWLRQDYPDLSGLPVAGTPEIVRVCLDYRIRNKVTPYVIGLHWKGTLLSGFRDGLTHWHGPLACPFPGADL